MFITFFIVNIKGEGLDFGQERVDWRFLRRECLARWVLPTSWSVEVRAVKKLTVSSKHPSMVGVWVERKGAGSERGAIPRNDAG